MGPETPVVNFNWIREEASAGWEQSLKRTDHPGYRDLELRMTVWHVPACPPFSLHGSQ